MAENGNGNSNGNGVGKLVYWLLAALMTVIGMISGLAHSMMMDRLASIERRLERMESDARVTRGEAR